MWGWEDVRIWRCDVKMWRWEDVKMIRCEDKKMWRCEDEKMWGFEDVMWRCEDEKMWRWEDVKMRSCEDEKMWRWEDVKMRRCEYEKMWRWEDVKMRRCEDEKMWKWEDAKIRRCEDEKVWRWEDVKMRRWDADPHYWKNPALRRSRELPGNDRQGRTVSFQTSPSMRRCRRVFSPSRGATFKPLTSCASPEPSVARSSTTQGCLGWWRQPFRVSWGWITSPEMGHKQNVTFI